MRSTRWRCAVERQIKGVEWVTNGRASAPPASDGTGFRFRENPVHPASDRCRSPHVPAGGRSLETGGHHQIQVALAVALSTSARPCHLSGRGCSFTCASRPLSIRSPRSVGAGCRSRLRRRHHPGGDLLEPPSWCASRPALQEQLKRVSLSGQGEKSSLPITRPSRPATDTVSSRSAIGQIGMSLPRPHPWASQRPGIDPAPGLPAPWTSPDGCRVDQTQQQRHSRAILPARVVINPSRPPHPCAGSSNRSLGP